MAKQVAEAKADKLSNQRPAIRTLGCSRLEQMIRRIFDDVQADTYDDGSVAAEFGLSKATFRRFAGSRWKRASTGSRSATVPDLWHNAAQTLARHPAFVVAAREAGVWKRVVDILSNKGGTAPHE